MRERCREKWERGPRCVSAALLCWLVGCLACTARAQAPQTEQAAAQVATGAVSGMVTDQDGDAVAGAKVTLNGTDSTTTDDLGAFLFRAVPAGSFKLTMAAAGFTTKTTAGTVRSGETTVVPALALGAASSADVTVTTSMAEVSKAEVKVEENQRLLGTIPNFFVAYDWNAPPLKAKQKLELSYRVTIDPVTVLISEATAGVEEANNQLSGYGKGGSGFVKRFAANQANVTIGTFAGGYLFPLILHQDPRYFYMGPEHGSVKKRFFYALSTGFITRGDNGKWQPNYSSVLGDLASGAAANAYYPSTDRHGWTTVIDAGLLGAAFEGAGNLVQEFVYKKLTPHAPNYPAGGQKP